MRFSQVLLVNASYIPHIGYEPAYLPSGLGCISEALTQGGINIKVIDFVVVKNPLDELIKEIRRYKPDIIGFSMMSFCYKRTYDIITNVKNIFPEVSIVVGGPHISIFYEEVLLQCPAIDFGVTLEGEETIVELCRGELPNSDIKGLLFRDKKGNVIYTGDRPFIKNLDEVHFPRYLGFQLDRYMRAIPIITSRGCPYSCIFCSVRFVMGRRFRVRSPENVINEIVYWYKRGYIEFHIQDDNFTLYPDRIYQFCNELERVKLDGVRFSLKNGVRADKVDKDLLKRMKEVGFYCLAFGVESGNETILKNLKKNESLDVIRRAISDATDLGYEVYLSFLIGSPGETVREVRDSINFALQFPNITGRFYNLIPFPRTELYGWVEKNNYFIKTPEVYLNEVHQTINYPIFETPELTLKQRKELYEYTNSKLRGHVYKQTWKRCTAREKLKILGIKGIKKWID